MFKKPSPAIDIIAHLGVHFPEVDGFCHPDWPGIQAWIEQTLPENLHRESWTQAARFWTGQLATKLGEPYHVHEAERLLILSTQSDWLIKDTAKFCNQALGQIQQAIPAAANIGGDRKAVLLLFAQDPHYYAYISHFYGEGEHPTTGGICLYGDGYGHCAFPPGRESSPSRAALAHELTHLGLQHLPLPVWLNEALAMRMETALCDTRAFELDRADFRKHEEHWNEHTIQQFWSGQSWNIADAGFDLSYQLARILWRKVEVDLQATLDEIREFAATANRQDAGEAEFQRIFEHSLGDLVADFLGDGNWTPDPSRWGAS